jgi:hypothetical protein
MKSFMVDLNLICIFHLDSMFRVCIRSFSYVNACEMPRWSSLLL